MAFEELSRTISDIHPSELARGVTDDDSALVEIGFMVEDARLDPRLTLREPSELEASIDTIFMAAEAGSPYARFLILMAAENQVRYAGEDAHAFSGGFVITDEELEELTRELSDADTVGRAAEPDPRRSLEILDKSLTAIELVVDGAAKE